MKKLFELLSKPAKWIFVVCAFLVAIAFAVAKAQLIGPGFNAGFTVGFGALVVMIVGTLLLVVCPVLVLMKRDAEAKAVFLLLLVYWLIQYAQRCFDYGALATANDAIPVLAGIFSFLVALCLVTVLVLVVIEFALKKNFLRFFAFLVLMAAIVLGLLAGIFLFIIGIKANNFQEGVHGVLVVLGYTVTVFFGYMYFFGAPQRGEK